MFGYPTWPLTDPKNVALPDPQAMGANPLVQDIFMQVDYMSCTGAGGNCSLPSAYTGHSHLPARSALDDVAIALHNAAPRPNLVAALLCSPTALPGQCPINIHFDVNGPYAAAPGFVASACANSATWTPDCALISLTSASVPRSSKEIAENTCVSTALNPCTFPGYATVRWKNGFHKYRDFYMPANRKDMFHYALFGHALGLESPTARGTPRKNSGIADVAGGDLLVTLGLWDNQVGSAFTQGSTLLHELGHNLGLRHWGVQDDRAVEPNCKPNYQSVMSYLFQVQGLLDANGKRTLDYSRQVLSPLTETSLVESTGMSELGNPYNPSAYLARWFAPKDSSFIDTVVGTTPLSRYCTGALVPSTGVKYVRAEARSRAVGVNWTANGALGTVVPSPGQDINFDGISQTGYRGSNDYNNMDLRQVGSRRSSGSKRLSYNVIDPRLGVIPTTQCTPSSKPGDIPACQPAVGGGLSLGTTADDLGFGDLGFGDLGFGDLGFGDLGAPPDDQFADISGDITFETAQAIGGAPSTLAAASGTGSVTLTWSPPPVGLVSSYKIYRVAGASINPTSFPSGTQPIAQSLPPTPTTYTDFPLPSATTYTYFIVTTLRNPSCSVDSALFTGAALAPTSCVPFPITGPSNVVTITTRTQVIF